VVRPAGGIPSQAAPWSCSSRANLGCLGSLLVSAIATIVLLLLLGVL
jgi:hypothetical protein